MKIVLYIGTDESYFDYFAESLDNYEINYVSEYDYFGYRLEFECDVDIIKITNIIIEFYIEFHLKNYILSKIYDEYPFLDVDDAVDVMCTLSKSVKDKPVFDKMGNIIKRCNKLFVDSYLVFNIRNIMLTIYDSLDEICEKISFNKERKRFLELLRTYTTLSSNTSNSASVEFASESECYLSFDDDKPIRLCNDKLIDELISRPPINISIKGEVCSPELSEIIKEIFSNNTKE